MDRVFLDANVLYAAAFRQGSPLRRLWQLSDVELWTSEYAAAQALGNLSQDRPDRVAEFHRLISVMRVTAQDTSAVVLPEGVSLAVKDRPVLLGAIQSQAHYLVTGDKTHFGPYFGQVVGGVRILRPAQYLASFR